MRPRARGSPPTTPACFSTLWRVVGGEATDYIAGWWDGYSFSTLWRVVGGEAAIRLCQIRPVLQRFSTLWRVVGGEAFPVGAKSRVLFGLFRALGALEAVWRAVVVKVRRGEDGPEGLGAKIGACREKGVVLRGLEGGFARFCFVLCLVLWGCFLSSSLGSRVCGRGGEKGLEKVVTEAPIFTV